MSDKTFTLYKLMILYMLEKCNAFLSNNQISDFMLIKEYATYFPLQQALSELIDTELVTSESRNNKTLYEITDVGKKTLSCFRSDIPAAIVEDMDHYLKEHDYELKAELSVLSSYTKAQTQGYVAQCLIVERNDNLLDLNIAVPTKKIAETICENWRKHSSDIYEYLYHTLME